MGEENFFREKGTKKLESGKEKTEAKLRVIGDTQKRALSVISSEVGDRTISMALTKASLLLNFLRHIIPIPLPGFAIVSRKGLAPYRMVFVPRIPAEHYDYVSCLEGVFGKKVANVILK
jgi:hypothetical protein